MKTLLLTLALFSVAPFAHAQIVLQGPGVAVVPPGGPGWHHDDEWRRRAEFREEERHEEWVRTHCRVDYRGEEYCRR